MKTLLFVLLVLGTLLSVVSAQNPTCEVTTPDLCAAQNGTFKDFFQTCTNTTCISGLIVPTLNCVINFGNGTCQAFVGYNNTHDSALGLEIGADNQFVPSPEDRGQPTIFEAGSYPNAFSVFWDCSALTWHLDVTDLVIGNTTTCTGACCLSLGKKPKYIFNIGRR
jgi:hypothetical protein